MKSEKTPRAISCDECGYEWPYENTNLVETHWRDNKDELFVVLAFHCPRCNEQYIVCVDNKITLSERNEVVKTQKAIQRTLQKGSNALPLTQALLAKKERLLVRLTKHQNQLKEAYLERVKKGLLKEANQICRCGGDVK